MDDLNQSAGAPWDQFCDVIADGLILWRLSSPGQADLWCLLFDLPEGLYFVVDDDPQGTSAYKVHEHHPDIINLLDRAEALKRSFLQRGWADVDVE